MAVCVCWPSGGNVILELEGEDIKLEMPAHAGGFSGCRAGPVYGADRSTGC